MINAILIGTTITLAAILSFVLYAMERDRKRRRQAIQRRNSQRWKNVFEVTDIKKA